MSTTYYWRPGAHVKGDPQAIGERLLALEAKHGGALTPALLVKDGRRKASPLHTCFEWDDTQAAHEYRLGQGRQIISGIISYEVLPGSQEKVPVRVFANVVLPPAVEGEPATRVYLSRPRWQNDPRLRRQVLQQALHEARTWAKRYQDLVELTGVREAIEGIAEVAVQEERTG